MKLVTSPLLAVSLLSGALLAPAYAENPYYANDIDAAVRDAERNGPNMNYVGNRWYNRTTSKSFDFPKLMNREMDKEVIEGALDSTAAGPGDEPPERTNPELLAESETPVKKNAERLEEELIPLDSKESAAINASNDFVIKAEGTFDVVIERIEFSNFDYNSSANNIRTQGKISATARP